MDAGLTIRPNDGAANTAVVRPNPVPVTQAQAVATDLNSSQTVTAATNAAAARNDSRTAASEAPATRVDISFDKKTHTAVYTLIDTQTGHVILQVPELAHADITV
jgi:uncharacterized FlaG/YvyC family protein